MSACAGADAGADAGAEAGVGAEGADDAMIITNKNTDFSVYSFFYIHPAIFVK